jgi:bacillithiol system protein YtxJ
MSEGMRDLADENALNDVKRAELAIIYKHSPICPVSRHAQQQVNLFLAQNPDFPIFVVNVVQERALSRQLADELGIRHESPQAILIQSGGASKHASHHQITAQLLEQWVGDAAG